MNQIATEIDLILREDEEEVLHPITRKPVTDQWVRWLIQHDFTHITKRGKVGPDWTKLMKTRRAYLEVPKYFGFTPEEIQTYWKCINESLVPVWMICRLLNRPKRSDAIRFLAHKQVPVYRIALGSQGRYYVFSGDIVRAIESCREELIDDPNAPGEQQYTFRRLAKLGEKRDFLDQRRQVAKSGLRKKAANRPDAVSGE